MAKSHSSEASKGPGDQGFIRKRDTVLIHAGSSLRLMKVPGGEFNSGVSRLTDVERMFAEADHELIPCCR